ncbi:MAG: lipopolysaccharide biosynthesis protein [Candidatus Korobacteraceae bacterium]|jgi:O-antigen/teichoic acid export membrane protein
MFRGFFSTWAGLIVNGIVTILLTRVLVHGLGNFYYGLWILVSSVLDYYGLLDMGVRYSMQRFVARYGGANERQALNETFMTGASMAACIAAAAFILCTILLLVLPGFFNLSGESRSLFRTLLIIQTVTLAVDFPARIMGAYLCGLHRFDLFNGAGITWGISRGLVFWTVIRLGGKVTAIAIAQLIIVTGMFILYWAFVKIADPQLSLGWKHTSWARTKELIHFSIFVFVSDLGDRLRFYTGVIIISHMLSVALSTPWNVITKLMETFKMAFYPITGPLNTEANRLEGAGKFEASRKLFLRATKMCVLLAFAGTTVLILHGRDILHFWIGEGMTSHFNVMLVLSIAYCVILMQSASNVFLYVRSRHRLLAAWTLAEGLANLALSIYWSRQYGILGVALGTAVPLLVVRLGIQPFYTLHVMEVTWSEYLSKSLLRPALVTALVLAIASVTGLLHRAPNLLTFAGMLIALGLLFAGFSYWIVLDNDERLRLRERGQLILQRLRMQQA